MHKSHIFLESPLAISPLSRILHRLPVPVKMSLEMKALMLVKRKIN